MLSVLALLYCGQFGLGKYDEHLAQTEYDAKKVAKIINRSVELVRAGCLHQAKCCPKK